MRAIVVGAGIGGLTATLSLRAAGHEVTLLDRTRHFTEIGAGIQLAPNATRVLRHLGLLDTVAARAAHPTRLTFHTWSDGTEICRYVIGPDAESEFGAPYLQVHRADLHQALADRVPPESVRLNTEAVGIDQDDRQAYVTTAGGECLAADLVVAADGVRSSARQWLFGPDEAVFSGTAAYRALLPAAQVADLHLPEYAGWLGPGRHVVHYWVRGGELLNLVAVFTARAAPESWAEWTESWTAKAEPGEQLREFAGWDPRIRTALERAGQVFRYAIHTRTPLTRWHLGRVTLLGDSAHAMVPFQAQGAAQAIMDAAVLGDCLAGATPADIPDALTRYVHRRLTTATRVQAGSASAGEVYHLPDGPEADARNARMAAYENENRFGPHALAWGEEP
ncbi:FAD-dependent monooxygenase [Streptomyces sp. GQFP]|uniref:FAD-dependent monooxygenase n=1 Tax=Streptomyces sp. GQFP TaxID=2907545 RepID=UPI001F33F46C|nr:FAD-dependent monooxygenase [Streptomyces sp. GQFP]UIX32141.1 FAD-dependent monooxygenase [Streptomyces sp. GQFP]